MELKDFGKKPEVISNTKESEERIYYPEFCLNKKQVSELKGAEIGDTVKMTIECRICGINGYRNGDTDYRFEIRKGAIQKEDK